MARTLVATFYHFTDLSDCAAMQPRLRQRCRDAGIKGTVLLAPEGINATLAGAAEPLRALLAHLRADPRFATLKHKESWVDEQPFARLKVRLKNEIVNLGIADIDPAETAGRRVEPADWNDLITRPDVVVIDTRNHYETEMGSFQGAVDPNTGAFNEFPQWIAQREDLHPDTPIAMYCTGGIRCEKASSYLLKAGFNEVYQLDGGILKYLEDVPVAQSLWTGECYVFDDRVSLNHDLERGSYAMCRACGRPVSDRGRQSPHYREGIACEQCYLETTDKQRAGFAERQRQYELAERKAGETPPSAAADPKPS